LRVKLVGLGSQNFGQWKTIMWLARLDQCNLFAAVFKKFFVIEGLVDYRRKKMRFWVDRLRKIKRKPVRNNLVRYWVERNPS
jgi:hypothetical protein